MVPCLTRKTALSYQVFSELRKKFFFSTFFDPCTTISGSSDTLNILTSSYSSVSFNSSLTSVSSIRYFRSVSSLSSLGSVSSVRYLSSVSSLWSFTSFRSVSSVWSANQVRSPLIRSPFHQFLITSDQVGSLR